MFLKNPKGRAGLLAVAALAFISAAGPRALGQEEGVPTVLDEPVAQVNGDVILLSQLKRHNEEFKEQLVKRGVKPEEAAKQIADKQAEIIINLINESLLMQKGKDIPRLSEEVEAGVNREVLRVAKESGLSTLEELEVAMRQQGMSLSEVRETLRRQYTTQAVLEREVDAKIYYGLTDDELRKYHEANRAKFVSVTLSEIFLNLAGRSEVELKAKAEQLAAQARGGADFGELALKNSEREQDGVRVATKTKGLLQDKEGKARWFLITDLNPTIAAAVKDLKAGGVSAPIQTEEGYMIIRVNERDDSFKENFVRGVITQERSSKEKEEYLRRLRADAYIKPAKDYRDLVQPVLDKDRPAAPAGDKTAQTKGDKNKKQ
ncbi:MAG TPA: peptidyl-prolyl cis-trans isomerase [Pyrinomonadaceae bacterium]|nr:peptidyl-prolyl cis-trans isomerase [Pyrinomonadaceae bacterium]